MRKQYDEEQIRKACFKINEELPDKNAINRAFSTQYFNVEISEDFNRKDLQRITVNKCKFIDCNFYGVAATGSKFSKTEFSNCNLSGANFQYCYFNGVSFRRKTMFKGTNLSHSVFCNCIFDICTIIECTLFDCLFENCSFLAGDIRTSTWENSTLRACLFKDINLAHINMEYIKVEKPKMRNTILSPYQIPYIIGATIYLQNTADDVKVYTDNGIISKEKYCTLYETLAVFFYSHHEYFPLANISIALEQNNLAFEYIKSGIREACDYHDFRMVKHFCRLACSIDNFTHTQLKELYDLVTDISYKSNWDLNILHSYLLNIGEIRELLMNNVPHAERVEFLIKTNISKNDVQSVKDLYEKVNKIISTNCSNSHIDAVELRHNSPYEFYVVCVDMLPNILLLISAMYSAFSMGNKFISICKNYEELRRVHQQNDLYQYEKEEKELDIKLKKKQLEQLEQYSPAKTSSNIFVVNEIEHNIKCSSLDVAQDLSPEYLHFKYKRDTPEY